MIEICKNTTDGDTYYFSVKDFRFYCTKSDGHDDPQWGIGRTDAILTRAEAKIFSEIISNTARGVSITLNADLLDILGISNPKSSAVKGHVHNINNKFRSISESAGLKLNVPKNKRANKQSIFGPIAENGRFRFDTEEVGENGLIIRMEKGNFYLNPIFYKEIEEEWKEFHPDDFEKDDEELEERIELHLDDFEQGDEKLEEAKQSEPDFEAEVNCEKPKGLHDEIYYEITDLKDIMPYGLLESVDSAVAKSDAPELVVEFPKYFVEAGKYRYATTCNEESSPITVGHITFHSHLRTSNRNGYESISGFIYLDLNIDHPIAKNCFWAFNFADYYPCPNGDSNIDILNAEHPSFTVIWDNQTYDNCCAEYGVSDVYENESGSRYSVISYILKIPKGYDGIFAWASLCYNPSEPREDDTAPIVSIASDDGNLPCHGYILYHCD